ncbi:MAG: hypothetical protein ACXWL2_04905 [Candidatus Chromulinivorax sp.]
MNYLKIFFIILCTTNGYLTAIFNDSPWLVIENQTPFDFNCTITTRYDKDNKTIYEDGFLILTQNNPIQLNIQYQHQEDQQNVPYLQSIIQFNCRAEESITINPLFSTIEGKIFYPKIESLELQQNSLQLTIPFDNINIKHRYFVITYNDEEGFSAKQNEIPLYIACCNNIKQSIRNVILALLQATNYLPY